MHAIFFFLYIKNTDRYVLHIFPLEKMFVFVFNVLLKRHVLVTHSNVDQPVHNMDKIYMSIILIAPNYSHAFGIILIQEFNVRRENISQKL